MFYGLRLILIIYEQRVLRLISPLQFMCIMLRKILVSFGFHADYLVTKCGVLMMSLFVFFTTTMSVSFTLRETQTRMLKFTGLCYFIMYILDKAALSWYMPPLMCS